MARGTDFGGVHSDRDLRLIQQKVVIQPAEPKLNLVGVPGADGSKDLSDQPAGRVTYKDRKITWTFALYPGDSWHAKHRAVSGALNGRLCNITLDDDPGYYYRGRLSVKSYNVDKALRQITVEAICSPWMLKQEPTVVTLAVSDGYSHDIVLPNDQKPVSPTMVFTHDAIFGFGKDASLSTHVSAGTYTSLDIVLQPGDNYLRVYFPDKTGEVTITYQEGAL